MRWRAELAAEQFARRFERLDAIKYRLGDGGQRRTEQQAPDTPQPAEKQQGDGKSPTSRTATGEESATETAAPDTSPTSSPSSAGASLLLESHVILDQFHAIGASRNLDRFADIRLGTHEAAQLNDAPEGLDVYLG